MYHLPCPGLLNVFSCSFCPPSVMGSGREGRGGEAAHLPFWESCIAWHACFFGQVEMGMSSCWFVMKQESLLTINNLMEFGVAETVAQAD